MNLTRSIGLGSGSAFSSEQKLIQYINLKLASWAARPSRRTRTPKFHEMAAALLSHHRETDRLLANYLCPADQRIQNFLYDYLKDVALSVKLPAHTLFWIVTGWRARCRCRRIATISRRTSSVRIACKQGVLHNPKSDRRTTQGHFSHRRRAACRFPTTRSAVPKGVFGNMLRRALTPPHGLAATAVHLIARTRRPNVLCRCCCARWFVRQCRASRRRKRWRFASSRPGIW